MLSIVKFDLIPAKFHKMVRRAAKECAPGAIEIIE
jgi:hypothetical protein